MTNTDKLLKAIFGEYARIEDDDVSEHPEQLQGNGTHTYLTKRKPLTAEDFKKWISSDVITDEDVIKAVHEALPNVNADSFYHNGSTRLRFSPLERMLQENYTERHLAQKYKENKLILQDIIVMMNTYDKVPNPDNPMALDYARALAQSSICFVNEEYKGKENN